jgi:hypothetical protein
VFTDSDLDIYRMALPRYFEVFFDEELFELVRSVHASAAHNDGDREVGSSSRMTVVVDSVSYTRPSHNREGAYLSTLASDPTDGRL